MRKFVIGICDDEKGTCAEIEKSVYRFFDNSVYNANVEVWYSGESCLRSLDEGNDLDILFLDIELPGVNGVDVGVLIRERLDNHKLQIVYISSKTGYAMELFKIHPYDFLIKPITEQDTAEILEKLLNLDENDSKTFRYKQGKVDGRIPFGKIMFLESSNKHVNVYMADGKIIDYYGKLSAEKEKLPSQFITVAKSYVVNMKYVSSFSSSSLRLHNGTTINITAPYREAFRLGIAQFIEGGGMMNE